VMEFVKSGDAILGSKIVAGNREPTVGLRFGRYRKKTLTSACRIDGPFETETSEGRVLCLDGWLCIDARGYPYPVAADEFAIIYEAVPEGGE